MQQILVYIALVIAIIFLVKKYFFTKKKGSCGTNCNC
ncbi:FeoB-associated Cys-rich membrane protein [Lutibacter sp. B1]|nr:FeoB-associated Cys-rich membrane protein [Lutibacter sp. B1]NLP57783.1 FeoB-associated Cys-rich membrane protein [Lutibacter sp. B1]